MNNLELAVRAIEDILPEMPTKGIMKWKAILYTAIAKIEDEMNRQQEHICGVCLFKEFGFRDQLPVAWREHGDLIVCFHHEDEEIADQLAKALEADKPEPVDTERTLEELMAIL